ncbi:MAG: PHP domain-containing protein [Vicinamibacterales bacterium]
MNLAAAALLYDMVALQPSERSAFGYKRAAKAIVNLTESVVDLITADRLRDVPFGGPASTRIIRELVESGGSPTVDKAIAGSAKAADVAKRRALRANFLSEHAMRQVLDTDLPVAIVSRETYRGDFQMHSTWSDGAESLPLMIEGCAALGQTCLGITDHSHGLPIAKGMSMETVGRQHQEIDALNQGLAGRFRVFKGIEANIQADGTLDLAPEERQHFDFVVAAPHARLRREEDQTARLLAAISAPGIAMLGHPRGRVFDTRAGVQCDWPQIFAVAAERGIAVELDGNWHRQDLDFALAAQALAAGCIFALDSDAHSRRELRFTDYAIAHARLAGIPSERVINCWSDDRLAAWMAERQGRAPSPPAGSVKAARARRAAR